MKITAMLVITASFTLTSAKANDIRVLVSSVAGARAHDPVVGSGYAVLPAPHVDLNVIWNATTRTFSGGFQTDSNVNGGGASVQFGPEGAIAYLPPTGRRLRTNSGTQYNFQGAMGDTFWLFPSSSTPSNDTFSLYLGFSGYGVPDDGTFTPLPPSTRGRIFWTVHSVENLTTPSANSFYGYTVSSGNVNMQLTLDPAYPNREMVMLANGHNHLNLLFKAPGMYRITFRVRGTLASTGQEVSSLISAYFGVEEWRIPGSSAPSIALSGNLAFGSVTVGQTATRTLTISNTGNAALNVSSISYPSGFSGNWNNGNIAAGSSTNVTVTFAPNAATNFSGNITVNSDATSGINTIAANGSGLAPWVTVLSPGQPTYNGSQTSMSVRMQSTPNTALNFLFTGSLSDPATWFTNNSPQNSGPTGEFDATFTAPGNHTNQWSSQMFFRLRY